MYVFVAGQSVLLSVSFIPSFSCGEESDVEVLHFYWDVSVKSPVRKI